MPTIINKRTGRKQQVTDAQLKTIKDHPSFGRNYTYETPEAIKPEGKPSKEAVPVEKPESKSADKK